MDPFAKALEDRHAQRMGEEQVNPLGQTPLQNFRNAWMLDTLPGQAIQSFMDSMAHPSGERDDPDYSPLRDESFDGYMDHVEDLAVARSPSHFQSIKRMIDTNTNRRMNMNRGGAGWSRFLAGAADPMNLIPIPLARGLGFVQGAKVGAIAGGGSMAAEEMARAGLDPTSTPEESMMAIGTATLLGAGIGGIAGHIGGRKFDDWATIHDAFWKANEARTRLNSVDPDITAGIRPMNDPKIVDGSDQPLGVKIEVEKDGAGYVTGNSEVRVNDAVLKAEYDRNTDVLAGYDPEIRNDPEVSEFVQASRRASREEKHSDPSAWSAEERAAYDRGDVRAFSELRGYTESEIANYLKFVDLSNRLEAKYGSDFAPVLSYEAGQVSFSVFREQRIRAEVAKTFFRKTASETDEAYNARMETLAKDADEFSDYVDIAKSYHPDRLMPTGTKIENLRWTQHPYLYLKNNLFDGYVGNALARFADETGGAPGVFTVGAERGDSMAQSIFTQAKLLNPLAIDARSGMYNAWLESMGKNTDNMGPMNHAVTSIMDMFQGKTAQYDTFKREATRAYLNGGEHADPHVKKAAAAFKAYMDSMGQRAADAGVFGIRRLEKALLRFDQKGYMEKSTEALKKQVDYLKKNRIPKINEELHAKQKILDDLFEQGETRGLSEAQLTLREKLTREYQDLLDEAEVIRKLDSDDPKFRDGAYQEKISGKGFDIYREKLEKLAELQEKRNQLVQGIENYRAQNKNGVLPVADAEALSHFSRYWRQDVTLKHREALLGVLRDWYGRDAGALERAQRTIDNILKDGKSGPVKRALEDAWPSAHIMPSDAEIKAINKRIDAIYKDKTTAIELRNREAQKLIREVSETYGILDDVYTNVAATMREMEIMASAGHMEGYGMATPMMARKLDIPSNRLIDVDVGNGERVDFIETDMEVIIRLYHRRMAPSIGMAERYGDPSGQSRIDDLTEMMWEEISAQGKSGKALEAEVGKVRQAMEDIRDKVLGVYGIPADPSALSYRAVQATKSWMVLALMGKASIAAVADVGRTAFSVGFRNAFSGAFARFGDATQDFKRAGIEVELAGEAAEVALHGRFDAMFDLDIHMPASTRFEKALHGNVNRMFIANLLSPYTDVMDRFSGAIIQSEMIRIAAKWVDDGSLSRSDLMKMTKVGIDEDMAKRFVAQWRKLPAEEQKGNKLHLANTAQWDDLEAVKVFRTALASEIDNAVIKPGVSEKINFQSSQIGGLMMQFKSFGMSATFRTLMAGLQMRDARAMSGMLSLVAAGYLVDMLKSPSYDSRGLLSLDRFVQAWDYSGAGGILMDLNNMTEVASGYQYGLRPMLGVESFWKDPTIAQQLGQPGGPAISLAGDLIYSLADPDSDSNDVARAVRRWVPYNNLFYFSWLVDRVQKEAGEVFE